MLNKTLKIFCIVALFPFVALVVIGTLLVLGGTAAVVGTAALVGIHIAGQTDQNAPVLNSPKIHPVVNAGRLAEKLKRFSLEELERKNRAWLSSPTGQWCEKLRLQGQTLPEVCKLDTPKATGTWR
jgi:hypothetical protein